MLSGRGQPDKLVYLNDFYNGKIQDVAKNVGIFELEKSNTTKSRYESQYNVVPDIAISAFPSKVIDATRLGAERLRTS